jgi:hypothetical protein
MSAYMKNPFDVFSPPESWHEVQQLAGGRDDDSVSTDLYASLHQPRIPPFRHASVLLREVSLQDEQ